MAESPASGPLHMLQSEFNGAKTQWEYLQDRIANGYKDAYKAHLDALNKMKKARLLAEQREARSREALFFVFSVASVGFAGGFVGGMFAPWIREVQQQRATAALRQGVAEVYKRGTQQLLARIVPEKPSQPSSSDAYVPISPDAFDTYLEKKEELDGCFAIINNNVQQMINLSNNEQWPYEIGEETLTSFRRACPLLRDVPDPNKDLPARNQVAAAVELAMWVAWTQVRDWEYWNYRYEYFEGYGKRPRGLVGYDFDSKTRTETVYVHGQWKGLKEEVDIDLDPIAERMKEIGKLIREANSVTTRFHVDRVVQDDPADADGNYDLVDLRKLRKLRLQDITQLPFKNMKTLDFGSVNFQLRGKFLDGLGDLRPFYKQP